MCERAFSLVVKVSNVPVSIPSGSEFMGWGKKGHTLVPLIIMSETACGGWALV
jgi:hypothetical protein